MRSGHLLDEMSPTQHTTHQTGQMCLRVAEHVTHDCDAGDFASVDRPIKSRRAAEHVLHARDAGGVQPADRFVEGSPAAEHVPRARDTGDVPFPDRRIETLEMSQLMICCLNMVSRWRIVLDMVSNESKQLLHHGLVNADGPGQASRMRLAQRSGRSPEDQPQERRA